MLSREDQAQLYSDALAGALEKTVKEVISTAASKNVDISLFNMKPITFGVLGSTYELKKVSKWKY